MRCHVDLLTEKYLSTSAKKRDFFIPLDDTVRMRLFAAVNGSDDPMVIVPYALDSNDYEDVGSSFLNTPMDWLEYAKATLTSYGPEVIEQNQYDEVWVCICVL